jgi:predicted nucleotidyltransferase
VVKTAPELNDAIRRFVTSLRSRIEVEKVILWGDYAEGNPQEYSDIRLMVISPDFERIGHARAVDLLAPIAGDIDTLIQAWGFTPREMDGSLSVPPLLAMALHESRQVYPASHREKKSQQDPAFPRED